MPFADLRYGILESSCNTIQASELDFSSSTILNSLDYPAWNYGMKHLSHYRRCPCRCSNKAASDTNQKRYLSQFVRVTLVSFHTIPPSVSLLFIFIHSFVSFFLSFFPFFASCRQFYICLRAPVSSCLKFLMLQHWLLELLASHQNSSCGLDRPTVIKRPSRCDS